MKTARPYKAFAIAGIFILFLLLSGCIPKFFLNSGMPNVIVVGQPDKTDTPTNNPDTHFILPDDYFIMEQPLEAQDYVYACTAKMRTAASASTNSQALFLRALDNTEVWSKYYVKTKLATSSDHVLGREVFYLSLTDANGNNRAPQNTSEAHLSWWNKARISNISEKNQGFVTVSGGFRVSVSALRVAVP
jgi:hypothetical protein